MECFMKTRIIAYAASLLAVVNFAGNAVAVDITGYSGVNLNIRSGPSTRFPLVGVLGAGSELRIHGCLARYTWCDVSASGTRGGVSGAHIQLVDEARRVYVPAYAAHSGISIVTFDLTTYWNDYYRDRDFYAQYDTWRNYHWEDDDLPPGWRDSWDDPYDAHEY
jgi:uncharacterized protein YraI